MAQIPFQLSWTGHLQWLLCRMAALSSSGGRRRTGGGRRSQAMENGIQLFQQQTAESDVPHLLKLALLQGWEQVVGMAQLVLGSRGKPGCPVPLPKGERPTGTVLIAVWETHNCADSVETARKISSSTTLRSSSVPKWIQQLRTRKLKSLARSTCPIASAQNLPSFLHQLCKGVQFHKESRQTPQMPFGFIWQDNSGARFFHPVPYLWIEMYCSTPGQIPFPSVLRNHHCFPLSFFLFLSLLSHHQPFCQHLHLYNKETNMMMKFWFSTFQS